MRSGIISSQRNVLRTNATEYLFSSKWSSLNLYSDDKESSCKLCGWQLECKYGVCWSQLTRGHLLLVCFCPAPVLWDPSTLPAPPRELAHCLETTLHDNVKWMSQRSHDHQKRSQRSHDYQKISHEVTWLSKEVTQGHMTIKGDPMRLHDHSGPALPYLAETMLSVRVFFPTAEALGSQCHCSCNRNSWKSNAEYCCCALNTCTFTS